MMASVCVVRDEANATVPLGIVPAPSARACYSRQLGQLFSHYIVVMIAI